VRVLFVAAARGRAPAADVLAAGSAGEGVPAVAGMQTLPRDIGSFTGREELASAADGVGMVRIHAIDGIAGIGKDAFAVRAVHGWLGSFHASREPPTPISGRASSSAMSIRNGYSVP
jgi:hypothetical protein